MNRSGRLIQFAHEYAKCGVAERAAIAAGYSEQYARKQCSRLLDRPEVIAELTKLAAKTESATIATLDELREFWTSVQRDDEAQMKDRLKAAELLGKTYGAFIEKREHSGKIDGPPTINLTIAAPKNG